MFVSRTLLCQPSFVIFSLRNEVTVIRKEASKIFVFIGCVGTGKSTQIRLLCHYLKRRGLKARSASLKTHFFVTNITSRALNMIGTKPDNLERIQKMNILIDLVLNLVFLPILSLFRIRLWKRLGYIVLIEEHLPGILVDYFHLVLLYKLNKFLVHGLMKTLYRVLYLNGAITIVLTCDPTILPVRWKIRGTVPEHSIYLRSQQTVFDVLSKTTESRYVFSTNKSIASTLRDLAMAINNITADAQYSKRAL